VAITRIISFTLACTRRLLKKLHLEIRYPDYTILSKRQKFLEIVLPRSSTPKGRVPDVIFDSTGLKVFGEGEWKIRQHDYS
jgi:hypothetical protein